jgi:hypothetical protein
VDNWGGTMLVCFHLNQVFLNAKTERFCTTEQAEKKKEKKTEKL